MWCFSDMIAITLDTDLRSRLLDRIGSDPLWIRRYSALSHQESSVASTGVSTTGPAQAA